VKIVAASVWPKATFKPPEAHLPGGYTLPETRPEPRITLEFDNGEKTTTKLSQMLNYQPPKP
jgi:hypothetical protein